MPVTRYIPIDKIVVRGKQRAGSAEEIAALAESIEQHGLLQPIGVDEDFNIVWGRRRLAACKLLKREKINATIGDWDRVTAELLEIDENLQRSELTQAERMQALVRRKELYEQMHPETKRAAVAATNGGKDQSDKMSLCFAADTAAKTGESKRNVMRDVATGKKLDKKAVSDVLGVPSVANSKKELKALSELPPEQQREVARAIKKGEAKTVAEALPEPKGKGQQRMDPRPFVRLASKVGECLRLIDAINKDMPAPKFHREALAAAKSVLTISEDWKKAVR